MQNSDAMKWAAAEAALVHVKDGMKLGLGTGSTAKHFVDGVGRLVADGMALTCVPTSEATRAQAENLNIPLADLDDLDGLDLTVDGADEVDHKLRLIKGGGGALLREKIVASASTEMIVIADETKLVGTLGRFPLPVEVVQFASATTAHQISSLIAEAGLAADVALRQGNGAPFVTDGGNFIYDCHLQKISAPEDLAQALNRQCGVVEHGLFIGLASCAYIATPEGVKKLS